MADDLRALLGASEIAVLAPHPDDETLGCGALLAAAFVAGRRAEVIVVTDGARSHPNSAAWPPERLAARRADEVREALHRLGGLDAAPHMLGYPDGAAPSEGPALAEAAARVAAILDRLSDPVLFAPSVADPHADHQASAAIAREAVRLRPGLRVLAYPIWSRHPGTAFAAGPGLRVHRFPVAPFEVLKRQALAAHASQTGSLIDDDPSGFTLPRDFTEMFMSEDEIYLEADDAHSHR